MKKIILSVLLLSASVLSAADLSGLYVGKAVKADPKYGARVTDMQISLVQAGNNVTGFVAGPKGPGTKFSAGAVSGNQVTFVINGNGGGAITAVLNASGNQLTGRLTSTAGDVFTVSLVKN